MLKLPILSTREKHSKWERENLHLNSGQKELDLDLSDPFESVERVQKKKQNIEEKKPFAL